MKYGTGTDQFFVFRLLSCLFFRVDLSVSKSFLIRVNYFVLYRKATNIKMTISFLAIKYGTDNFFYFASSPAGFYRIYSYLIPSCLPVSTFSSFFSIHLIFHAKKFLMSE
jgi:hypothetical protein